jgi:steroid 5-alpha reductase family enzyme
MFDFHALTFCSAAGLVLILLAVLASWVVSFMKRDVSIVDSMWSVLIVLPMFACLTSLPQIGPRAFGVLVLAGLWAIRLAAYITWRNWGEGEDYRYREIRARNEPRFEWKSLYLVFALQGLLAWTVSVSLIASVAGTAPLGWLDALGGLLFVIGFVFEAVADAQLVRFRASPANRGKVLASGLWRYTRHPNYFGEFCIWWAFYLLALSAGGWWSIVSPLLMSVLLLKVSGVALLEKNIGERRPAYREYIARTNAFFPGLPRP